MSGHQVLEDTGVPTICCKRRSCFMLGIISAGLMISGFSQASQVLGDKAYLERAIQCAQFVKKHLYNSDSGTLFRNAYRNVNGLVQFFY